MKDKKPLFSLTLGKDLFITYTKGSGPGGQRRNKIESAVRLRHPASGTEVYCCDQRSRTQNEKIALQRLVEKSEFKTWVRVQASMLEKGYRDVEHYIDTVEMKKIKIETKTTIICDQCKKEISLNWQEDEEIILPKGWTNRGKDNHWCNLCSSQAI